MSHKKGLSDLLIDIGAIDADNRDYVKVISDYESTGVMFLPNPPKQKPPKPILFCTILYDSMQGDMSIHTVNDALQEKMRDYHVIVVPHYDHALPLLTMEIVSVKGATEKTVRNLKRMIIRTLKKASLYEEIGRG